MVRIARFDSTCERCTNPITKDVSSIVILKKEPYLGIPVHKECASEEEVKTEKYLPKPLDNV